jgi:predicted MPP superfamily phosphohydrolase
MPTDIKPWTARKTWLIQSLYSMAVKLLALKGTKIVIFTDIFCWVLFPSRKISDTMQEMAYFITQESHLSAVVITGVLESDNNEV